MEALVPWVQAVKHVLPQSVRGKEAMDVGQHVRQSTCHASRILVRKAAMYVQARRHARSALR